jgi:superfamily I DNA and RNA helicase
MGFGLRLEDDIKNVVDRFCKTYDNKKLHHVDLDATAWDWQFGEVGYDIESYIITESCINPTDAFRNAIRNLKQLEKRKIFQFSKGDMIAQVTPGLVASGKFDTTQQNSNVNSFIMYYFGAVNRRVAGDDGLAAFRAGFRNRYIEANMNMKFNDIDKDGGKFEFCSNYWGINKEGQYFSYPVHYEKMVFKFLSINYNKAIEFEELKRELKFHPDFNQIVEDIEDLELPFEDGDETPETGEGTEILKSA